MKELIIGTTNQAKIQQIKGALTHLDLNIKGIDDKNLPEIIEDGKTAEENARKKALTYAKFIKKDVLSVDNALYFEGLDEKRQPGLQVRRIQGRTDRPTDEEVKDYYISIIQELGGKIKGYFLFAVCIASPKGQLTETTIKSQRIFISKASDKIIPGYPLASLWIDPVSGKYPSEMSEEERDKLWQNTLGLELSKFLSSNL